MRKFFVHIKPRVAFLALVTGILLSLLPPHVTDAADYSGHKPQQIVVPQSSAQVDVQAKFREAVYIKVEHEKFQMPLMQDGDSGNGAFVRQAAVSLHGADGEIAFLFCDVLSEQALLPGRHQDASMAQSCDGSGPSRAQAFSAGHSANTGVAMTEKMFSKNGKRRYISLEVAYI